MEIEKNRFKFIFRILIAIFFVALFEVSFFIDEHFHPEDNEGNNRTNTTLHFASSSISTDNETSQIQKHETDSHIQKHTPFNQTNPHEQTWCPYAKCYNSPLCSPCNRRFLFIIATGRSGSTTLLTMFNKLPNIRLSGENLNALYEASKLSTFFESMKDNNKKVFYDETVIQETQKFESKKYEMGAFAHNPIPLGSMSCIMQSFMRRIDPPDYSADALPYYDPIDEANTIIGAKVIRIQNGQWSAYKAAKFFQQNFPCARFIINIRSDEEAQLDSMSDAFKWDGNNKEKRDEKKTLLAQSNEFLFKLHTNLGNRSSIFIDMSQWKDDVTILNEVVNWLGFQNCAFNGIVHENHDRYGHDIETDINLGNRCRLGNENIK